MFYILLCLLLLIFYLLHFLSLKIFYVRICIHPVTFVQSLDLLCLRLICCMVTQKYSLVMIHLPHLVWQEPPPYLYHNKYGYLLTNKRELASQVTGSLNIELYELNIGGGYNTTRLMFFSSIARTFFLERGEKYIIKIMRYFTSLIQVYTYMGG